MKRVQLQGFGHENITARHKTTMEFTHESEVSFRGDCLVARSVVFDPEEVRSFLQSVSFVRITIQAGDVVDVLECVSNPDFFDENELVVRMSGVQTKRTLGIRATKSARMLNPQLVERLSNPEQLVVIVLEEAVTKE